jgi:hypothetical protein
MSRKSISQLSLGGQPGHGRCRRDQFAEPQADHKRDRRIALRTRGLLRQIGESRFPIGSMTVAMSTKRLRDAGAPDERFAKQTQFVVGRRCGLRGFEIETPNASGRLALRTSISKRTHFTFRGPEPPGWPRSARHLGLKVRAVVAFRYIAHGGNVRPREGCRKTNPICRCKALRDYEGPRSTDILQTRPC